MGHREEARALLERASALPSPQPVVWARLGELAVAEGRHAEAVELLSAVLDAVPQATRLHHALGLAYRGLGDMERARHHLALRGEIGLAPEDPLMAELATLQVGERVHLLRGRAAFRVGNFADAAAEFRGAVDARPESVRARINLSAALAGLGDVGGATRELERAVALDPGNPTARFNLAILLASAGEHRLAVIHFAAATAARPEDEEAWLGEAASWIALRDFGRAADRLALAGGTLPESGRIALGLARLLAAAPEVAVRDGERALDLAQRVFDAQRSADHAVVVSLALRELGRCDAAREWLEGLIAQGEASGDVATLRVERARLGETTPCRP
jgi:tetratricopeptide (TPR) repeat protein